MNSVQSAHHDGGSFGGTRRATRGRLRTRVIGVVASAVVVGTLTAQSGTAVNADSARRNAFVQTNLVSDLPGRATLTDPELKNPWGIAFGPTTPLWVNNQFNPASACPDDNPDCIPAPADLLTKITLYAGANGDSPISKVPLEVRASSPTGIVFNPTSRFKIEQGGVRTPARFLFNENFVNKAGVAPEGRITGWSNVPSPAQRTTSTDARKDPALHFGLALVRGTNRGPLLLAADGLNGTVDVFDAKFHAVKKPRLFVDRRAAQQGFAAYNVAFLKGQVYVTYVSETRGALSVFTRNGRFVKRLVTSKRLLGPWGMAVAPRHWGPFGGQLLVGNVDDGKINAFDRRTGKFRGTLRDASGKPLVNIGLWGIAFGNGTIGTRRSLIFAAGVGEELDGFGEEIYEHGLVGMIEPARRR